MKILIAGDYSPRNRVAKLIENDSASPVFELIKPVINSVNYSIVNFETTVIDDTCKPIDKCGPNLSCSKKAVKLLKDVGFDCVTLANNHFRDFADDGVRLSVNAFNEFGLDYVGGGMSINEAQKVLYKDIDGKSVAFVNVCENEFSIATTDRAGCAPLDAVANYYQIKEAKDNADVVIMIIHGGHEHYQLPSLRMKRLYRYFIDLGADAVINHHQHCYSGYEYYHDKPIVYGLGNFCFDGNSTQRNSTWNEGYLAILNIGEKVNLELFPYEQCNDDATIKIMDEEHETIFKENITHLNDTIADDRLLEEQYQVFIAEKKRAVLGVFTPYQNEYVRAAASRHWIPYFLPKSKILAMINYIICEAQRDATIGVFNEMIKK